MEKRMKKKFIAISIFIFFMITASMAFSAYHHEGEMDSDNFLEVYPEKTGTKLDHCALCHSGGKYINSKGSEVTLGSCQWCHYSYGYDASGNIAYTLNQYGRDYYFNDRNAEAIRKIKNFDSDGDGFLNDEEIQATRFPGDANDDPTKKIAPFRIYTKSQLEAMTQHTQFLMMNTSRSGDFYAEYTGVPMEDLLEDAGILDSATGILVYAPDGWSNYHPLEPEPDPELYYVRGTYPQGIFHYAEDADEFFGGWCDYSAPSCIGRSNNDPIFVQGGLKMILAIRREGVYLDHGILTQENKLDGEGPFRLVPPQKTPSPPDQSSRDSNPGLIWPYEYDWDHNAGASSRTVTIIKVLPLPPGTTDFNLYETGWPFVDEEKIIIYGAIFDPNAEAEVPEEKNGSSSGKWSYPAFVYPFQLPGYPGIYSGTPWTPSFGYSFNSRGSLASSIYSAYPIGGYSNVLGNYSLGQFIGRNFAMNSLSGISSFYSTPFLLGGYTGNSYLGQFGGYSGNIYFGGLSGGFSLASYGLGSFNPLTGL